MIEVGTRVRSYDFESRELEGERACYIEGTVEKIECVGDCDRYFIRVERDVFYGIERTGRVGIIAHPPVNGTPTSMGRITGGVEPI